MVTVARVVAASLVTVLVGVLVALAPSPSYAGPPASARPPAVTGTVVTYAGGSVSGLQVRLRSVTPSGPGQVVGTAKTNAKGQFAVTGGSASKRYYVELVAGTFQRGWAGGKDPRYWQFRVSDAETYLGGAKLGAVVATPSFVRGTVVDSGSGKAVAGVKVTMSRINGRPAPLTATTNQRGQFRIDGLVGEDFSMRFTGSKVGHEDGYWGCTGNVEVADLECQASIGVITKKIRIDPAAQAGTATAARDGAVQRYVSLGRVGLVKARMTKAQAVATGEVKADTPGACPGTTIPLRPTYPFNREFFILTGEDDSVVEMGVFGKRVRTPSGLGVGNTVAAVKKVYGSQLSAPTKVGYGQWGRFVSSGYGSNRVWIGFLFGEALVADGPLTSADKVTLVGVSRGARPELMADGC